jgi:hypothetical protein
MANYRLGRRILFLERLEERSTPSTSGVTWPDGAHLTLSFVPDGTRVSPTAGSDLFATLDAVAARAAWQGEIVRAFQTWAARTNVNVGIVADGGQPLGAAGTVQGDARFGDVRIAAAPLPSGTLMTNTAFQWSGTTWSGDVLINSSYAFTAARPKAKGYDLYTAMLNEAGNVLGVLDSHTDTASGVYWQYVGPRVGIDAADVADVQSLYGRRSSDHFDAAGGNDRFATATDLGHAGLDVTADVTTARDQDFYKVTLPASAAAAAGFTARVTTSGFSLLQADLQVYDAAHRLIGAAAAADSLHGDLAVTVSATPGRTYYLRVAGHVPGSPLGVGGYKLSVISGSANGLDLAPRASAPAPSAGPTDARFNALHRGTITGPGGADTFKITAPHTAGPQKLNALVWAADGTDLAPKVDVYDASRRAPLPVTLLANGNGTYSVEAARVVPGATYFVKVSALNPDGGHYALAVKFNRQPASALHSFDGGTLTASANTTTQTLTVSKNRLYEFALSAGGGPARTGVRMDVVGDNGEVLFSLSSSAGQPAVTGYVYLQAGSYAVRYVAIPLGDGPSPTRSAGALGSVNFSLSGQVASDPIGPGYTGGGDDGGDHGDHHRDHWGGHRDQLIAAPIWDQPYYF